MTFRNKILLSIWAVVLSLLVITFFIINYWIRGRIEATFSRELRAEYSTVSVHEQLQAEQLIRACVVVAESPRLRAVAELGDARTASQLMQEIYQTTLSPVLVLTDRKGQPLVQLLRGTKEPWIIPDFGTIRNALRFVASTNTWAVRGAVYRIVSVPIVIESDLIGTLTSGFEITAADVATLKRAINSDILLVRDGTIVHSTLDSAEAGSLPPLLAAGAGGPLASAGDSAGSEISLVTRDETYLGTTYRLDHDAGGGSGGIFYVMLKPLGREVHQYMGSILGTFGLVSLIFLALTTIVGLVISRGMTRPIRHLIGGHDRDRPGQLRLCHIAVRGKDELSFLAQRFMEMSASLKEKITHLGQLNEDLLARNKDLDETLRQAAHRPGEAPAQRAAGGDRKAYRPARARDQQPDP